MERDKDLQAVRKAHAPLGRDIKTLVDVAAVSLQGCNWRHIMAMEL